MIPSLIDRSQLLKDPRKLAFMFPKMPVGRYKELTEDYHRKLTIIAVEKAVAMFKAVLLPARCIHHHRRDPERRMMLYGRTYYVFDLDDVTELEWAKYRSMGGSLDEGRIRTDHS